MKIKMDRVRRSVGLICVFWAADRRRARKSMNVLQYNDGFRHTIARLQKTDKASEVMRQVLDNST
jgi:hypothetical protein